MSNNAMSNETDLDWLARNVHKWVPNELLRMKPCDNGNGTFRASWCYSDEGGFTKDQWLSRRAELQNKPSWDKAESWAEWLAQDEDGEWKWLAGLPGKYVDGWTAVKIKACCKGLALGDWRDTLEKRPADLSEQAVTARLKDATDNVLAAVPELMSDKYKFTPFTSIEDNQEKDMKQDNGWFERGELPPVGFECEMKRIDGRWCKAVTVGKDSGGRMVCELNDNGVFYASTSSAESFRPIRTERDELIEIISSSLLVTTEQVADAIIAAGFKLEAK